MFYLTPLKVTIDRMSSGSSSASGHWKLSIIGMILHLDCSAAQTSCKQNVVCVKTDEAG